VGTNSASPPATKLSQDTEYALWSQATAVTPSTSVIVRYYTGTVTSAASTAPFGRCGRVWQMLSNQDMAFLEGAGLTLWPTRGPAGTINSRLCHRRPSGANVYDQNGYVRPSPIRVLLLRFRVPLAAKGRHAQLHVTVALYAADGNHQPQGLPCAAPASPNHPCRVGYHLAYLCLRHRLQLSAGTEYALVISASGGNSSNRVDVRTYAVDGYSGGRLVPPPTPGRPGRRIPAPTWLQGRTGSWRESQPSTTPGLFIYDQGQAYQTFTTSGITA